MPFLGMDSHFCWQSKSNIIDSLHDVQEHQLSEILLESLVRSKRESPSA